MPKNKTTCTPKAKSKPRAESIKLNLTPEQAVGEIIKGCIENGYCEIWSEYPFKEGKISSYYAPGQHPKYGMTKPITPEQLNDVEKILGPLTLPKLRVFLTENFNIADLNCLTWDELLLYFQRFVRRQTQQTKSAKSISGQTEHSDRKPVSKRAGLILKKLRSLPEHEGMTMPNLLEWLSVEHKIWPDEGTVRRYLKELDPYGLKRDKPKIGYYIPIKDR